MADKNKGGRTSWGKAPESQGRFFVLVRDWIKEDHPNKLKVEDVARVFDDEYRYDKWHAWELGARALSPEDAANVTYLLMIMRFPEMEYLLTKENNPLIPVFDADDKLLVKWCGRFAQAFIKRTNDEQAKDLIVSLVGTADRMHGGYRAKVFNNNLIARAMERIASMTQEEKDAENERFNRKIREQAHQSADEAAQGGSID